MNAAVNVTTFSLIFSIHFLILAIWNQSLFWVIAPIHVDHSRFLYNSLLEN